MESVSGVITGLGSPADKKRLVELTEPGKDLPKKLRVWTTLQDGTPNYLNAQVEEAFAGAKPVSIAFEVNHWKTPAGEDRKQNVIVAVGAADPTNLATPAPAQATGQDSALQPGTTDDTTLDKPAPVNPPPLDLADLAGAIRATITTLDDIAQTMEGALPSTTNNADRARQLVQQLSGELPDVAPEQDWKAWS